MSADATNAKTHSKVDRFTWLCVFVICLCAYTLTGSGRITYPDDEINFRTAESLYEHASFAIEPMDRRSGEPKGRPDGTFGVAPGQGARADKVYGFFGQGLPLLSVPFVALGDLLHDHAPSTWRHAIRSDLFSYARRTPRGDLRRLAVVWSSAWFTAMSVCVLGWWLLALGCSSAAAVFAAFGFGLGSAAWSYTSTYLSEPASALFLLLTVWQVQLYRNAPRGSRPATRSLGFAALACGFSVHLHLLNLLAIPFVLAYALGEIPEDNHKVGQARRIVARLLAERAAWTAALALGASCILLLGLSQWWRFGSPFASGRYDHYAHWVLPLNALAAFVVSPGRSVFVYAPMLLFGFAWWRASSSPARARLALPMRCMLGLVLLRAAFVACRSDWFGGWGMGPRYLFPVLPLLMLPAALAWERANARHRRIYLLALATLACVQGWLASHAMAEHMMILSNRLGSAHYVMPSHWSFAASPFAGFWELDAGLRRTLAGADLRQALALARLDLLPFGALRLLLVARDGSLLAVMGGFAALGAIAGIALGMRLRKSGDQGPQSARSPGATDSQPMPLAPESQS